MEPHDVRELIELISRSNFREFELERDGFRIKLVKTEGAAPAAVPTVEVARPAPAEQVAAEPESPPDDGTSALNSPIVGTFYRSPGPDKPAFVEVGDRVTKGQVMCIVEAMKVMNEIESDIDGEIVEIAVADAQPVEYGEVLFRLRPA